VTTQSAVVVGLGLVGLIGTAGFSLEGLTGTAGCPVFVVLKPKQQATEI